MPRRPFSAAARSPARPWSHTAQQQAANGSMPCASRLAVMPVRISPLPPFAMPSLPVVFTANRPSGAAITVR